MITISLCMIVKNEGEILERCLNSIKDAVDEIIIVDTGSSDNTIDIAKKFTKRVSTFKWTDDFSEARNFSFLKAKCDYIMWLDADDVITEENLNKLIMLKNSLDKSVDVVMMKYNTAFDEKENSVFSYYRERLLKREKGFLWKEPVHECIDISGNIIKSDISINHKKEKENGGQRNLNIYKKIISNGKELSVRGTFYYAKELFENEKYKEAIEEYTKFLNMEEGYVEDKITACYQLAFCYESLNDIEHMQASLLKSFSFTVPRAEIVCKIAQIFFIQNRLKEAIFWYKLALNLDIPDTTGFIYSDCYSFIPAIELCVCYNRLGDNREAVKYHNLAKQYKPDASSVIYNEAYFKGIEMI